MKYFFSLAPITFAFVTANFFFAIPYSYANPLDDLLLSKKMRSIEDETRSQSLDLRLKEDPSTPWFDKRSAYGKIFYDEEERQKIAEWLFSNLDDLRIWKKDYFLKDTHILVEYRALADQSKQEYQFQVWIPHPAFFDLLDVNMIKEFEELTPEPSTLDVDEKIEPQGRPGKLYKMKDGRCSVVIPSTRRSVIRILGAKCMRLDEIVEFAKELDFPRYERQMGISEPASEESPSSKGEKASAVQDLPEKK